MLVKRLKEIINDLPDYERIFIRVNGMCGNICWLDQVELSEYSSFGIAEDCIIFNNERVKPDIVDDYGEIEDLVNTRKKV